MPAHCSVGQWLLMRGRRRNNRTPAHCSVGQWLLMRRHHSRASVILGTVRDWDVLQAFMNMISDTGAFDGVYGPDLPEQFGRKAESKSLCFVARVGGTERENGWDDPDETQWERKVTWTLTVQSREKDPLKRDRTAERLLNIARRAVNADVCVAGVTIIGRTHLYEDRDLPAVPPMRAIRATGEFSYLINGPNGIGIEP